jgi:SAM-dependent methyltransferase
MCPTQTWDPDRYARNARFVSDLGAAVFELLAPRPGERILDLGCGEGALTEKLVAAGGHVLGIDSSREQVEAACARGLDARVGDGEALAFDGEFDAVFSNAALHWMSPDRVIDGVWRALRAGGRFVGEFGGHGCVGGIKAAIIAALDRRGIDGASLDPWYFPTDGEYAERLRARGFDVRSSALIPRPTPLPGDIGAWMETFGESFLSGVPEGERTALIDEVREVLRPTFCNPDGTWWADYVRLRFSALKPA